VTTDTALDRLVNDLASADPVVRDEGAYVALSRLLLDGGVNDDDRAWVAEAMLDRLEHERAEARSFAPLVLALLVNIGDFDESWVSSVARWYIHEDDLRGHDEQVGWVHAVAHGADFFGECGAAGFGDAHELLEALARRLVVPTRMVWRDQEDDRVACALALVLTRDDVDEVTALSWLAHVRSLFETGAHGPVPAEVSNTMRTLRSLHVALGEQVLHDGRPVVVPHADVVRHAVRDLLSGITPWFWRTRST